MDYGMMEEKQMEFVAWLDKQIAACGKRQEELLADDCADESDFEKIKANIYDIFRTIFSVALRNGNGDADAVNHFFLLKMEEIPSNWKMSYDKAKQHDDVHKMQIEEIKLDAVRDIRAAFERIQGVKT